MKTYTVEVKEVLCHHYTIEIPDDIAESDREEYFFIHKGEPEGTKCTCWDVDSMELDDSGAET